MSASDPAPTRRSAGSWCRRRGSSTGAGRARRRSRRRSLPRGGAERVGRVDHAGCLVEAPADLGAGDVPVRVRPVAVHQRGAVGGRRAGRGRQQRHGQVAATGQCGPDRRTADRPGGAGRRVGDVVVPAHGEADPVAAVGPHGRRAGEAQLGVAAGDLGVDERQAVPDRRPQGAAAAGPVRRDGPVGPSVDLDVGRAHADDAEGELRV